MKVKNDNPAAHGTAPAGRTADTRPVGRASRYSSDDSAPVTGHDQVQLSDFAGRIAGWERVSAAERAARVQELTRQVQTGKYSVDSHKVSQKIVAAALNQNFSQ